MFKRVDRLLIDLPQVEYGDPNAAAAVQELLGGKFGEMSTLNNYMYQSFNFRCKKKLRPFYELVASITAEEFGHVELVANTINLVNNEGYYDAIRNIWKGNHPQTNAPLIVIDGFPKGAKIPDLDDLPEEFAPGIGPEQFEMIAKRLLANM